jgi:phage terminase Nu1 subunit (DNA packaging protein)
MDYVTAGWPPKLIRDRLNLTDQQIGDVMAYIAEHRAEVEAEYHQVLEQAAEDRRYWETQNQERFARAAASPPKPEQAAARAKLAAAKAKLDDA